METIVKEKIEIALELLEQIQTQVEKQVIVHCIAAANPRYGCKLRLWKSIVLIPKESTKKCQLIQSFNIALYPVWQHILPGKLLHFTLIFEGLPKDCSQFDLVEMIPEPDGFEIRNITRNELDVYHLSF